MSKLRDQLEKEAAAFGIIVSDGPFDSIELEAPQGMRFDEDLHILVNAQDKPEPFANVLRAAIQDVRTYGPRITNCPADCGCKEST